MAIRTYKVTLDSKNTIAPEPVFLRQGDKTGAVVIDATLMDNGSPVSLSGLTPMFKANTADGKAVIADSTGFNIVNASGGEFTYQVPNALSSVPGKITTAYFSFSDSSGSESTFDVAFIINKAVDITQAQADDYITIIDGTVKSLQQKIDAMNTDVQTILNAYNQGDFYNKSETDNKDAATLTSAKSYTDNSLSGIVSLVNAVQTTPWVALTTNTNNTSGKLYIRRNGGNTELSGQLTLKVAGSVTNSPGLFSIPAGYQPATNSDGRASFRTAFDFGGTGMLKAQLVGNQFVAIGGAANVAFQINWIWDTVDDFPA